MDLGLKGKTAVIFGGTTGIGAAAALRFGKEGCRIAVCSRSEEKVEAFRLRAEAEGLSEVLAESVDAMSYEETEAFADRVVKNVLPDECIALRFVNKAYREVITKPETLYWNVFEKNEFQLIHITRPHMEDTLPRMYMDLMAA